MKEAAELSGRTVQFHINNDFEEHWRNLVLVNPILKHPYQTHITTTLGIRDLIEEAYKRGALSGMKNYQKERNIQKNS
jgi:hypothetical protein